MAQNRKKGTAERKKSAAAPPMPKKLSFDYIKSNFFRVIHCDGVVGGLTPNGWIHMAAWSSRQPFPQKVVHELTPEGTLGAEIDRTGREVTFIRELEADIVFSPAMAEVIIGWLQARVSELKAAREETEPGEQVNPEIEHEN
jgi:hypothetical protein